MVNLEKARSEQASKLRSAKISCYIINEWHPSRDEIKETPSIMKVWKQYVYNVSS
uniref:Uncharacterized protein n=1 Tax=Tetranychus urticae TaxID=32264 RepID=T1K0D1_TETUR